MLTQLDNAKYFTEIDIYQAFYQIKILKDSEKSTTFQIQFVEFKYMVISPGLYNRPTSLQYLINDILFDILYCFV